MIERNKITIDEGIKPSDSASMSLPTHIWAAVQKYAPQDFSYAARAQAKSRGRIPYRWQMAIAEAAQAAGEPLPRGFFERPTEPEP